MSDRSASARKGAETRKAQKWAREKLERLDDARLSETLREYLREAAEALELYEAQMRDLRRQMEALRQQGDWPVARVVAERAEAQRRERELAFRLDIAKGLLEDHNLIRDYEHAFEEAATEARMEAMEP